jgi:N utilization substance protein B
MSSHRSRAREVSLQLLFQHDLNPGVPRRDIERFLRERLGNEELEKFALALYDGVRDHAADIDARLSRAAENWRLHRMATVDRNVLRLGAFELLHPGGTAANVVLNEAIELARRFGSADSAAFVNGVLDRVYKEHQKEGGGQP